MNYTTLLICAFAIAVAVPVSGQSIERDHQSLRSPSFGLWVAHSPSSNSFFAKTARTHFTLAGLDYTYAVVRAGHTDLLFSTQLIIYSKTDFPLNGRSGPRDSRNGVGLTPLRLTIPFTMRESYPYITAGGGLMLFHERFPNRNGTRLNATVDLGLGYNIDLGNNTFIDIGYRFHHLSNGDSGDVNPGLDSNMFIATWKFALPRN